MNEIYKLTLTEVAEKLKSKQISATEMISAALARIEITEPNLKACLTILGDQALADARKLDKNGPDPTQPLWGVPVTVKDVFCTKGIRTTAASRYLENYIPAYDAQVVIRLRQAGAVIVAKTNLDEFAMGSSTEFSAFGPTRNPWNLTKVPGGSSGGAAASVVAFQTPGALGTDTGGSIRQPATLCGCVGLKPTYGRVSRYGIVAYGSSLDQAGPLARRVRDCASLLSAIAGYDDRDATSSLHHTDDYAAAQPMTLRGFKLGLPQELWNIKLDPDIEDALKNALKTLEETGVELKSINLPHIKYSVAAYYILAAAEASTNLARYDGVRYGRRSKNPLDLTELYMASRSEALGPEVRRRILLGTFALSAGYYDTYYKKAAQIRRLIRDDYYQALTDCDLLITPVSSLLAWDFGSFIQDPLTLYQLDLMTLPVNLAGLPALALPITLGKTSGLPVGLQLIGRPFDEINIISAGLALEELFPPLR